MYGGAILGQGAYGCTFDHVPKCISNEISNLSSNPIPKKQIVKTFFDTQNMFDEWNVIQKIAHIDPNMDFFLFPTSMCLADPHDIQKDKDYSQCRLAKKQTQKIGILKMPNGGISLGQWVYKNKPSTIQFLHALLPVFKGCELLQKHGIIHHDLKFDNILFNPKSKQCRIIDFGLMIRRKDALTPKNPYLYSDYWLHPPEYRVATYIQQKKTNPTSQDLQPVARHNLSILKQINLDKNTLYDMMHHYLRDDEYTLSMRNYLLRIPFKPNHNRVDVYSLGITLMHMSLFIKDIGDYPQFRDIVRGMLYPNPYQRWSIQKVIRAVTEIISSKP